MFDMDELSLHGCYLLTPRILEDSRGQFIKLFHNEFFETRGLKTTFNEEYYSVSKPGVLRGMHFQYPPMDHEKLVTCIKGEVIDVLVDLRSSSETFQKYEKIYLNENSKKIIYVPKGIAHGFYVKGNCDAIMLYKTSTVYSKEHDGGVLWNSIGIDWELKKEPIISERDKSHVKLSEFNSPF